MWMPSSVGVDRRAVGAQVAAARLAPAPGRRSRSRAPAGRGRRAARAAARGCASGRRAARPRPGSLRSAAGSATRAAGGGSRRRLLLERGAGGAGAEDEALAERVGGEPVGAVQARAGALADGVEAGQRGAAVEVDRDPAHRVVGGGGDRDRLGARVEPRLAQRLEDVGEAGGVDLAQVEADAAGARRPRSGRGSPP